MIVFTSVTFLMARAVILFSLFFFASRRASCIRLATRLSTLVFLTMQSICRVEDVMGDCLLLDEEGVVEEYLQHIARHGLAMMPFLGGKVV